MTDYATAQAKPGERFAYAPRGTCEGDGAMKIISDPDCPGDKVYAISKVAKFATGIPVPIARFNYPDGTVEAVPMNQNGKGEYFVLWTTRAARALGTGHTATQYPEPKPSLSDFTASIEAHLLPLLPGKFRCVSDIISGKRGKPFESGCSNFVLWILDQDARELAAIERLSPIDEDDARDIADDIARTLMSRQARG